MLNTQKVRYMDVLTVRPSCGTHEKTISTHAKLLVEPVVLPNMAHLSVDQSEDVQDSCIFYPTGRKNM